MNYVFEINHGVDIRRARLILGLTQKQTAKAIGVEPATLSRHENSKTKIRKVIALSIECLLRRKREIIAEDVS